MVPFINTLTFAARGFWSRRGASDAHTRQRSVRSEQRSLGQKELPPVGLCRIWPGASLLLSHRPLAGMLLRRASPQAKCGATNVSVFMKGTTKPNRGEFSPKSERQPVFQPPKLNGVESGTERLGFGCSVAQERREEETAMPDNRFGRVQKASSAA